jgi:hypothetical protein
VASRHLATVSGRIRPERMHLSLGCPRDVPTVGHGSGFILRGGSMMSAGILPRTRSTSRSESWRLRLGTHRWRQTRTGCRSPSAARPGRACPAAARCSGNRDRRARPGARHRCAEAPAADAAQGAGRRRSRAIKPSRLRRVLMPCRQSTRTTRSATSAAPRGSSSSWQSRSADGSGPRRPRPTERPDWRSVSGSACGTSPK